MTEVAIADAHLSAVALPVAETVSTAELDLVAPAASRVVAVRLAAVAS